MTNYGKAGGLASQPLTIRTPDNRQRGCYTEAMRYLVLTGLILGSLLGYYVLWSHLADQVAAQADAWIEGQRRQGRGVSYESRRLWGFPYRLSLTLTKATWDDPRQPLTPRLEAEEITAHLQLWQREHVIFDLPGRQNAVWNTDGTERRVSLNAERFRASLVIDGAGNWLRVAADLTKPRLQGPANGMARGEWAADKLLLHARRAGNVPPSLDLAMQVEQAMMPEQAKKPFGRAVQSLRLTGNLRGGFYGNTTDDLLASWRDGGGVIDFSTIALTWGNMRLAGTGSLALDREFRPLGAMGGTMSGAINVIELLEANGLTTPQQASAAKTFLLAVKEQFNNNGLLIRDIALTAQDGQLSLGENPLLSLPSVLPGR